MARAAGARTEGAGGERASDKPGLLQVSPCQTGMRLHSEFKGKQRTFIECELDLRKAYIAAKKKGWVAT